MNPNSLTIIIPTLNEENTIGGLLSDLQNQTLMPDEIIVVDGGSSDKTKNVVKRYNQVRFILAKPPVANQRNVAAEKASGDILVFLDADVRLPNNFTKRVVSAFEKRKLDIACPLFYPKQSNWIIQAFYTVFNFLFVISAPFLPSGASTALIVRRKIFLLHKGFKIMKFEDIELIRRIGNRHAFGILYSVVNVSDRRFREYGIFRTIVKYLLLSVFFTFGLFSLARFVSYPMGSYSKKKS